jgi:Zn-dependent M16 (insulinase) family peptidase
MKNSPLSSIGQKYNQFTVTKYTKLPELQATLVELTHDLTGASVMHIANDDPENLFCLSFQTLPSSSNGVAHILEHTVLCGSKKYPVKDPFFSMTRRSLNTFMNAFTGQDFTCYPASSQVEKDFYNLLEVYLDATFHPRLKKTSFLQEGHRLEFSNPKDSSSPLQFQGIVYNEMKGDMSSPDSRLWEEIHKKLLPDLTYANNSGGDPKEIPSLTYEQLVDFHKTYYHPSRCIFFFYGNLPLEKHLDFIAEHALKGVERMAPLPPLPLQKRFKQPVFSETKYPSESGDSKTQIAFCWLTTPLSNQTDVLAISLIECFLLENDASPLKMGLLKSGLCKDVESSIDTEISEVPFAVICHGCDDNAEEKLKNELFKQLRKIVDAPIEHEQLEAALHQLELERTEIGGEGGPFGLTLFFRSALIKHHGNQPELGLEIHSLFANVREKLKDPTYIPSLIRKYLIDNPHLVIQKLIPDADLEKKEKEDEAAKLAEMKAKLTDAQKQEIIDQSAQLLKDQEETEHQSIDCLPKVSLDDIPKKARDYPLLKSATEHLDIYTHETFTNGFIYADLFFDLPQISNEDLPFLSLLSNLWTELGTTDESYEETMQRMQAYTGGVDAHIALHASATDSDQMKPTFSLRGKALARNGENFFNLLYDFASGLNFSDEERIEEWLSQHASELENDLIANSSNYATQLALSGYSTASYIYNQWSGLPYYEFVLGLAKLKKKTWIAKLKEIATLVTRGKPVLVLGAEKNTLESLKKHDYYKLGKWKTKPHAALWNGNYPLTKIISQARFIPAAVAYTSMGMRTVGFQDPDCASLMLGSLLLKHIVLHKEIREKGGAYGGSATYTPTSGNFHMTAYRDPNLSSSIAAFKLGIETIGNGQFSERELEEAKISIISAIDTPIVPGGRASLAYSWLRSNRPLEDRQKLRELILNVTKEQVSGAISRRLKNCPSTTVSLLGEQLWKKEEKLVDLTLIK